MTIPLLQRRAALVVAPSWPVRTTIAMKWLPTVCVTVTVCVQVEHAGAAIALISFLMVDGAMVTIPTAPIMGAIVPHVMAATNAAVVTHSFAILGPVVTAKLITTTAMGTWAISFIELDTSALDVVFFTHGLPQ